MFLSLEKPIVIAFLGRAGSGKTSAAKYLKSKYQFKRMSLAYPLKMMAKDLWNFTDEQVFGTQEQKERIIPSLGISSREALQCLGESGRNRVGKDVWIRACFKDILDQYYISYTSKFCVDDARYISEAQFISDCKDVRGIVVKLICPDAAVLPDNMANHPSEKEVDLVPAGWIYKTIESYKSPDCIDLKNKLDNLMKELALESSLLTL